MSNCTRKLGCPPKKSRCKTKLSGFIGGPVCCDKKIRLNDLCDVDALTPEDNDLLIYDESENMWTSTSFPALPLDLSDLSDVDTTGVANGDFFVYNGGAGEWQPSTVSIPADLSDLSDVDTTGVANGDVLRFVSGSSEWQAQTPPWATVPAGSSGSVITTDGTNFVANQTICRIAANAGALSGTRSVLIATNSIGITAGTENAAIAASNGSVSGNRAAVIASDFSIASGLNSFVAASATGNTSGREAAVIASNVCSAQGRNSCVVASRATSNATADYSFVAASEINCTASASQSMVLGTRVGTASALCSSIISSETCTSSSRRSSVFASWRCDITNSDTQRVIIASEDCTSTGGIGSAIIACDDNLGPVTNTHTRSVIMACSDVVSLGNDTAHFFNIDYAGSLTTISDSNAKREVIDDDDDPDLLTKLKTIKAKKYKMKGQHVNDEYQHGFDADDMLSAFPQCVKTRYPEIHKVERPSEEEEWVCSEESCDWEDHPNIEIDLKNPLNGKSLKFVDRQLKGINLEAVIQTLWTMCQKQQERIEALEAK